jgi:hypothetical protein
MAFLRRLFRRADYESDVTQFIAELKKNDPQLEARQRQGRSIWWDREQDRAAAREWAEAKVPQKPYVYGTEPTEK